VPFLILSVALCIAAVLVKMAFVSFRVRRCSRREKVALWTVMLIGAGFGFWLGAIFQYQVDSRTRFVGFPLPIAFFRLESDRWTDFVTPGFFQVGGVAVNVLLTVSALVLSFGLVRRLILTKTRSD
jgi:hypothetical protein